MTREYVTIHRCNLCQPERNQQWAQAQVAERDVGRWLSVDAFDLCPHHTAEIKQVLVNLDAFLNRLGVTYHRLREVVSDAAGDEP